MYSHVWRIMGPDPIYLIYLIFNFHRSHLIALRVAWNLVSYL